MILKPNSDSRVISIASLISCISIPLLLFYMSYKNYLFSIVKHHSALPVAAFIFATEIIKCVYINSNEWNDPKSIKKPKSRSGLKEVLKSTGLSCACVFIYFIGIILFGAPFASQHDETLVLAMLLSLLTVYPLSKYVGAEMTVQLLTGVKGYNGDRVVGMYMQNTALTLCGAWAGATVIPLDWDRPWQAWPIPCYYGALVGYIAANVLTVLKCSLGHKIKLFNQS